MTRSGMGVILAALLWSVGIARAGTPAPSALPKVNPDGYTSSEVCGQCHEDIHRTWKNSLHAMSLSDPVFDAAYWQAIKLSRGSAKSLCLRCHAPTTRITKDFDQRLPITAEGVSCDFCHTITAVDPLKPGEPFRLRPGLTKWGPLREAESPVHKVRFSSVHTTSELCGGCHEFLAKSGAELMGTYSEWKAGPYAQQGVQCQSCHMPVGEGRVVRPDIKDTARPVNLHNIQGGHSPEQIRKAAQVEVRDIVRTGAGYRVVVSVANVGSGHMIPTGIPTRQLTLVVQLRRGQTLLAEQETAFRKVVVDAAGNELKTDAEVLLRGTAIRSDNRIFPKEVREVSLVFPYDGPSDFTVEAKLYYRYPMVIAQPEEITVEMAGASRAAP